MRNHKHREYNCMENDQSYVAHTFVSKTLKIAFESIKLVKKRLILLMQAVVKISKTFTMQIIRRNMHAMNKL